MKLGDAADQGDEAGIFLGLEAVRDGQRLVDLRFALAQPRPPLLFDLAARIAAREGDGNARRGASRRRSIDQPRKFADLETNGISEALGWRGSHSRVAQITRFS